MKHREAIFLVRILWLAALALVGLVIGVRLWRVAAATGPWDVVGLIYDDAYYYLTVAANTVDFGRSTLDGSTLTNGYQPMWFVLVTLLGFMIGTDSMRYFGGVVIMVYVIAFGSVLAGFPLRKSRKAIVRTALAIGIALAIVLWSRIFLWGMETILLLPLIMPLVLVMESRPNRRRAFVLSGLFALAFLVRLDALALVPAYVVITLMVEPWVVRRFSDDLRERPQKEQRMRFLLPVVSIVSVVVLIYAGINMTIYGTPIPVSGAAKSVGPKFENLGVLSGYAQASISLGPLIIAWIVVEATAYRAGVRSRHLLRSIAVCSLACGLQATYYVVASTWDVWDWYYYFLALLMIIVTARVVLLCSRLWEHWRRMPSVIALAVVLLLTVSATYFDVRRIIVTPVAPPSANATDDLLRDGRVYTYNEVSLLMMRDFLRAHPPHVDRIAMGDRAGGLSYWGRGAVEVVQTEGLMLGYSYIKALQAGTATSVLESDKGIEYYVVDRDRIPKVQRAGGEFVYVVADPIQAMRTGAGFPVALFCFPSAAIRYRQRYMRSSGPSERVAFAFDERVDCTPKERSMIADAISGNELRKISLPNEYK